MMINSIIFFQLRRVLILALFFLLSLLVLTTKPFAQSGKLNKIEILKSLFISEKENKCPTFFLFDCLTVSLLTVRPRVMI